MTRKHPIRRILGITAAISLACGAATFGPALPAAALYGEVQIKPIESDISARYGRASSVRVLTTADGSAKPVPVAWDAVPDGGADA
ncbi:MAG: hypothetical protein HOV78_30475, partial [Hamadaea sp.]|nr:hypothetical protein [Hamadaea sp.]